MPPAPAQEYARLLSAVAASLDAAGPGADPLAAAGGRDRWAALFALGGRLGKPPDAVRDDLAAVADARRHRATLADAGPLIRLVALYLRLLRRSIALAPTSPGGRTARRLLAKWPTTPHSRFLGTLRRRAKMARRGLKRLEGERPELVVIL